MPTILIRDETAEGRNAIRESLTGQVQWTLLEADTAEQAIALLESRTVDLIVSGFNENNEQHDTLLRWLHEHDGRLPVVLLTQETSRPATVDALLLGAASFVPRSVIARDLRTTVDKILTLSGCRRRDARVLHALEATESKFTLVDNDSRQISALVGHLIEACEQFAVTGHGNRSLTAMALEEAMTNGIVHGNLEVPSQLLLEDESRFYQMIQERRSLPPYCDRKLSVMGMFRPGEAQFTIRDEGPGFDPRQIEDPTLIQNWEKPYGRGLFLIRAFMDDVSFNDRGNEIRLIKCGPRNPVTVADHQSIYPHDLTREVGSHADMCP